MMHASEHGLTIGDRIVLNEAIWRVDGFEGSTVRLVAIGSGEALSRSIHDLVWDPTFATFVNGATDDMSDVLATADVLNVPPEVMTQAVELARHVEEMLHGLPVLPDEVPKAGASPKGPYGPERTLAQKYAAKVRELEGTEIACSMRQLERYVAAYRKHGILGLVPKRHLGRQVRKRRDDPRYLEVLASQALAEVDGPERGTSAILAATRMVLRSNEVYADVEIPSLATQKRRLSEVLSHVGWRKGRRKYVQSAKNRPDRAHAAVTPLMPGERVEVDTTILNVLARDPYTGRTYRPYLSVAMDVATRCVVGMVVASFEDHTTVQSLMMDAMTPKPQAPMRDVAAYVNRLGVAPEVLREVYPNVSMGDGVFPEGPLVLPRTVVIDQGRSYFNRQVLSMLGRIGTAVELARPATPTDKPHVERFFRSIEPVLMGLKGYVGTDVAARGKGASVDVDELLTEAELETVLRAWVAMVYHHRRHSGLHVPVSRGRTVIASPMEMFTLLVEEHGFMPAPLSPTLRYLLMSVERLTIQSDGISLKGLRYDTRELDHVRGAECPWSRDGLWQVHYDPMDCRQVYVLVPNGGERLWVEVPWKHRPPEMRHPFPHRVLKFARSHQPTVGSSGGTMEWKRRSERDRRVDPSEAAADASIVFLNWVATEVLDRRAVGQDPAALEMRAIRAWASSLYGTPLERLEERYLGSDVEDGIEDVDSDADGLATDVAAVTDAGGVTGDTTGEDPIQAAWRLLTSEDDLTQGDGA